MRPKEATDSSVAECESKSRRPQLCQERPVGHWGAWPPGSHLCKRLPAVVYRPLLYPAILHSTLLYYILHFLKHCPLLQCSAAALNTQRPQVVVGTKKRTHYGWCFICHWNMQTTQRNKFSLKKLSFDTLFSVAAAFCILFLLNRPLGHYSLIGTMSICCMYGVLREGSKKNLNENFL